jgi:PAS domain S-box-containing protein
MNETGILTQPRVTGGAENTAPKAGRAFFWTALGVMACLGLLAGNHMSGRGWLSASSQIALASTAGACLVATLFAGVIWRERAWLQRLGALNEELHAREAALSAWRKQFADCRRENDSLETSLAQAKTQFDELSGRHARLQAELDERKKVERTFTKERQVLETSKSVLEMHVEARTRELHKLQHRYELILNSAGEGICGLDPQGKATFVNPVVARITGWPIEELLGKTEQDLFQPKAIEGQPETEAANSGERVFLRKDGSRFPVEYVRTQIEEGGQQTGSVLIFKDITERKRAEAALGQKAAELARSNAELEQFAFVASHDLQEPLRKIQAFGDRLKTKLDKALQPDSRDYLERMQNASARMRTLIDDLLAFSRVIRSAQPFVPVDLGHIAKEVLGDLEMRIEKNGAHVELDALPTIDADPTQMRQLLLNLIGNALKFQPPGAQPLVMVSARTVTSISGEQFCELVVEDNGIGFEDQYAEKIFAVFQRLHGRGEYEGTGVGLAVCRRIADRHHGTIVAKGRPGKGATFTVTLPVRQAQPKS